jgi:hypothetical protein
MTLSKAVNLISIRKKVGGNFSAALAIAARALLDINNNVVFDPDFQVAGIPGSTLSTAPAIVFTDIATGLKYAMVVKNGAPEFIQQ